MSEPERYCKTCAWWDRDSAMDKAGRVRKDRIAVCLWSWGEVAVPSSIRPRDLIKPHYMGAAEGSECPCWKERSK